MFHRRTIVALTATVLTFGSVLAGSATAAPEWRPLDTTYGSGPALLACVEAAHQQKAETWTCVGGDLTTTTRETDGRPRTQTRTFATDPAGPVPGDPPRGSQAAAKNGGNIGILEDDYDDWCENGSVCGRQISTFIAEVKGNAAYGDITGVIGAFDFVVRQEFNGPWPRWHSVLIWDYGPTLIPLDFAIDCRINLDNQPDDYCGTNAVYFGNVSPPPGTWRSDWPPSETGLMTNEQRLVGNTRYHDDAYGTFSADGYYDRTWGAPPIHTGRWYRCASSVGCQYYEVPWHP
jgi:hypothetical protein